MDSVVTGLFGVICVAAGVLLDRQIKVGERKGLKVEKLVLLASRVESQLGALLTHIGINQTELTPLLAENLENKSPTKSDFQRMIADAMSAYPLPTPEEIPFPKDDSTGYPLVAMSAQTIEYVREANAAAEELRAGKQDAEHVSNFVVLNDRAVSKDIILAAAKAEFEAYLETLEEIFGRKMKPIEKDASVKNLVNDLERTYSIAVKMGENMNGYRKVTKNYLRNIGW